MTKRDVLDWAWGVFSEACGADLDDGCRTAFDKRFGAKCQDLAQHPRFFEHAKTEIGRVVRIMGAVTAFAAEKAGKQEVDGPFLVESVDVVGTASGSPFCN